MARQKQSPPRSLESYYAEPTKEIALEYAYQLKNICFDILDEIVVNKEQLNNFSSGNYQRSLGVIESYLGTIRLINFSSEYNHGNYWLVLFNIAKCRKIVSILYFGNGSNRKGEYLYGLNEVQECIECALDCIIDMIQELEQENPY